MTRTFNWRIVVKTMGALLCLESFFMCVPLFVSWWYEEHDLASWIWSVAITLLSGLLGLLISRRAVRKVGEREGYVIVALVWVVYSLFGLLPFYLSGAFPTFTDCLFEMVSGFTTTGATIAADVDILTHAVLLWRALSQWMGGMGIIVISMAILPIFGLSGMQLYAAEMSGVSYEKLTPKLADSARIVGQLYIGITLAEIILLFVCGMPLFDAICHSFSTIATGGFSTQNSSLIAYSPAIHYVVAFFMFLAGINFTYLIHTLRGKPSKLFRDEETRWYIGATVICVLLMTGALFYHYAFGAGDASDIIAQSTWYEYLELAFRKSFFTVATAMTSTGYAISDYLYWPPVLWAVVVCIMIVGGSSGSTAGGMKWVRVGIFAKSAFVELRRRVHPNAIIPVRFNGSSVNQKTISNVVAFVFFYLLIMLIGTIILCATGISFAESFGSAVSSMGNMGVSIGYFAPPGSYIGYSALAKWTMSAMMLIGRLEIFTILLLFTKVLWQK